jgi:TP901 family phage tail tape measure protein
MITFRVKVLDDGTKVLTQVGQKAKQLEVQFGKTGDLIGKAFGGVAMYAGISAFLGALKNTSDEVDKFHLAMRKVEQVGGITGAGLSKLSKEVMNLAASTEYSQSQIADAGVVLARMGYNTSESIGRVLPAAMNLSTVAGEDLFQITQGLAQIINVFGLQGRNTTQITNEIGVALNATALNLKDYMEAMQYAGPVARGLGYDFETTTAMIAQLSQSSIVGSRAGTSLKNTLLGLIDPSSAVAEAIRKSHIEGKNLADIFGALEKEGVGVKDFMKSFGMWALPGSLALSQNSKALKDLLEQVRSSKVDMSVLANAIRQESIPAYKQLWNTITNVGIAIGEALGIKKGDLIRAITKEIKSLIPYIETNKESFKEMGKEVKVVVEGLAWLIGGGSKQVIKNLKEITEILTVFFGIKMIQNGALLVSTITAIGAEAKIAAVGLNMLGGPIGLALITATTLWETIKKITDKENGVEATLGKNRETEDYYNDLKKMSDLLEKTGSKRINPWGRDTFDKNVFNAQELNTHMAYMYGIGTNYLDKNTISNILANRPKPNPYTYQPSEHGMMGPFLPKTVDKVKPSAEELAAAIKKVAEEFEKVLSSGIFNELGSKMDYSNPISTLNNPIRQNLVPVIGKDGKIYYKQKHSSLKNVIDDKSSDSSTDEAFASLISNIPGATSINFNKTSKLSPAALENKKMLDIVERSFSKNKKKKISDVLKSGTTSTSFEDMTLEQATQMYTAIGNLAQNSAQITWNIEDQKHAAIMNNIQEEQDALKNRYDAELAAAEGNAFKQSMITQKYNQKQIALEKKAEIEKDKQARRDKERAIFQATIANIMIVLGAMKDMWGGPVERILGGITIAAAVAGEIGALTAASYRSGGIVDGPGNGSSDSMWAKVSRGERIMSVDEVSKLGGNERIQQMLDQSSKTSNRNVNINIGTVIGNRTFVRQLIDEMKEELTR